MRIFFIVGTGRCGTQMLRNILNEWPSVRILPETHFIVPLYNRYGTNDISPEQFLEVVDNIYSQRGSKFIHSILFDAKKEYSSYKIEFFEFIEKHNIQGNIKTLTEAFFEYLYGRGDYLFGDKTPHYGIHASIIRELWHDAKFIHIQRDGVDVAHSMLGHGGFVRLISKNVLPRDIDEFMYGKEMGKRSTRAITIEESLPYWERAILETEQALSSLCVEVDYLNVKYEDIVFHPEREITRVSEFLDIRNDGCAFNRAIAIPRPFPEYKQVKKLNDEDYQRCLSKITETMEKFGYPYEINLSRGALDFVKEFYRGRYYYLGVVKQNLKSLVKSLMGR